MTESTNDLDATLQERFSREHAQPPGEPFVSDTARRIAAARARGVLARRTAQGVALAALILASPWLIKAAALLSLHLNAWLATTTAWLLTPVGMVAGLVLGVGGVVLARARGTRRAD
jgi:hypothetical protein